MKADYTSESGLKKVDEKMVSYVYFPFHFPDIGILETHIRFVVHVFKLRSSKVFNIQILFHFFGCL